MKKLWLCVCILLLGLTCTLFAQDKTTESPLLNAFGNAEGSTDNANSEHVAPFGFTQEVPEPKITAIMAQIGAGEAGVENSDPDASVATQNLYQLQITVELPQHTYMYAEDPNAFQIVDSAKADSNTTAEVVSFVYPKGAYSESAMRDLYKGSLVFSAIIRSVPQESGANEPPKSLLVQYQICDNQGVCYFPTQMTVSTIETADIIKGIDNAEGVTTTNLTGVLTTSQPNRNFWLMLLFALLGGILMNLMPCVLPVLFLRVMAIAGGAGETLRQLKKDNYLFLLGMGSVILALGVITLLLRTAGLAVGWGFQFQDPLFTMALITIIFLFALSLFGLFEIPGVSIAQGKSSWGNFGLGALGALMAAPCTAPLLGSAIGYALSLNAWQGGLFFLVIALGFVLPLLLVTAIPGFWKLVPKPGRWMRWVRVGMGAVLFGMILYLGYSLKRLIVEESFWGFFLFLLGLAGFIAIVQLIKRKYPRQGKARDKLLIIGMLAAFLGGWIWYIVPASRVQPSAEELLQDLLPQEWQLFSEERVKSLETTYNGTARTESTSAGESTGEADEPTGIFISFSASWCSTCKINEQRVLFTKEATQLFQETGVTPFYADFTRFDPTIAKWIDRFGRSGVPLYLYKPAGSTEYQILPQILSIDILQEALQGGN